MASTVDADVQQLKDEITQLELEAERIEAVTACANLANKYQFYHCTRSGGTEEAHLFALKSPGACVEMVWGIYDEPEGVIRWKVGEGYGKAPGPIIFVGMGHGMTTPIIEVAEDAQTARGLWIMIGSEGSNWAAGQFAMDFIKEDGEWKIWKYNTVGLICSPFEKGWHVQNDFPGPGADIKLPEGVEPPKMEMGEPDRPPSYRWMWGPNEIFQNIPPVPLPYKTWDDSLACVPVPGRQWEIEKFD